MRRQEERRPIRGVLFDFNGTMLFDSVFHDRAWRQFVLQRTGHTVTEPEFLEHIQGRSAVDILSYFLRQSFTPLEAIALEEEKEQHYRSLLLQSEAFHLAQGLPELLDRLREQGIPCTIATASGERNVAFFFEHLALSRWFRREQVICNDGTFPGKPAPDIFLRAAQAIGVPIGACAVFEDASSGIRAAKAAGAGKIIGITSTLSAETLLSLGADQAIPDYTCL